MKEVKDNFSQQVSYYKKYRPEYPEELYEFILSKVDNRSQCWDCGTGNGQVAKVLSNHFDKVYATDISAKQIEAADQKSNIEYVVARAEETPFRDQQFDLITVAQAIHWFDFDAFNAEVRRVGKPGSKICVWGYGLLTIDKAVDEVVYSFYDGVLGSYWNEERKHIDMGYESVNFDFKELEVPKNISIHTKWKREQLIGYLNSWSSVQHYKKAHKGENPVGEIESALKEVWKDDEVKAVRFPVFIKLGLI